MNAATEEALITRWIVPNPHKPGAATSWVLPGHVSVWAVIRQLELEDGNVDSVADAHDLPRAAVEAATIYYQRHKLEIDARIRENRAFFGV